MVKRTEFAVWRRLPEIKVKTQITDSRTKHLTVEVVGALLNRFLLHNFLKFHWLKENCFPDSQIVYRIEGYSMDFCKPGNKYHRPNECQRIFLLLRQWLDESASVSPLVYSSFIIVFVLVAFWNVVCWETSQKISTFNLEIWDKNHLSFCPFFPSILFFEINMAPVLLLLSRW